MPKKYDLHVHTRYSRCSLLDPSKILGIAKKRGLDGIAITDHNEIKGALEVKKLNKDKDFEVIIGEEVSTPQGEVLALYLKKKIPPGQIDKVLKEIKKQGGISIIAHPFSWSPIARQNFDRRCGAKPDAIEVFNARSIMPFENRRARKLAETMGIAMTGSSDAHFSFEIGEGMTIFEGDLRKAIRSKKTGAYGTTINAYPGYLCTVLVKYVWKPFFWK